MAFKLAYHYILDPLFYLNKDITTRDYLCVRLAGLCHDIGHGPFSHMFERFVNRKRASQGKVPWHHETASIAMVRLLVEENAINIEDYGLEPCDIDFVCHLIDVSMERKC